MIRDRQNDKSIDLYLTSDQWRCCSSPRTLKQTHAAMVVNGFNSSAAALRHFVFSAAVAVSCGIDYAHKAFAYVAHPDIFMWNAMIKGSATSADPSRAVALYTQMLRRGVVAGLFAYTYLLEACARLAWVPTGLALHGRVVKSGFFSDQRVRNSLIYFHSHCGDLGVASALFDESAMRDSAAWSGLIKGYAGRGDMCVARKLFDEMPERDVVCLNVMITGYAMRGDMGSARRLFDDAPARGVATWNALIEGYATCGRQITAVDVFEEMMRVGVRPDEITMLSVLSACTELGDLRVGDWVYCCLREIGSGGFSMLVGNALIRMYAKCGSIATAVEVFRGMRDKDVTTWNSLMRGLSHNGRPDEVLDLYKEMLRLKISPSEITFLEVLVACSHTGKVVEGMGHFNLMRTKFKIKPNVRHYGCIVDILGRAGLLAEAFKLVETMEVEPNDKVWRFLIRACRVHGNVELGNYARERLERMRMRTSDYRQ